LLELISEQQHPNQTAIAQMAFTVGIMSLMDTLFSMPMEALLEKIKVAPPVREALLMRSGSVGDMLRVAEQLELSGAVPANDLQKIGLPADTLQRLQLRAFEWANMIMKVS
jgi:c-di-GMP phosphodiesterase